MANIEIKVCGINKRDIQMTLTELAQAFGVSIPVDLAKVINDADMTELFDLMKARFASQGFTLVAESQADAAPAKRGRKPKLSPEEAREILAPSESLEEDNSYTEEALAALKAATLLRIGKHWQDDEGRQAMTKILKEICVGFQYFRDTPPALFPKVSAAVDEYEQR